MTTNRYFFLPGLLLGLFPGLFALGTDVPVLLPDDGLLELLFPGTRPVLGVVGLWGLAFG